MSSTHFALKNKISNCMDLYNETDPLDRYESGYDGNSRDSSNCCMHLLMKLVSGFDNYTLNNTCPASFGLDRICAPRRVTFIGGLSSDIR